MYATMCVVLTNAKLKLIYMYFKTLILKSKINTTSVALDINNSFTRISKAKYR